MSTIDALVPQIAAPCRPLTRLRDAAAATLRPLQVWRTRLHDRTLLGRMPDYLLRDIGLQLEDVLKETRKPFWWP